MLIKSETRTHLSGSDVKAHIDICWGTRVISDACAITIASWYASPSGYGTVFTELSTTGQCDNIDMMQAIMRERRDVSYDNQRYLDCLGAWVIVKAGNELDAWKSVYES